MNEPEHNVSGNKRIDELLTCANTIYCRVYDEICRRIGKGDGVPLLFLRLIVAPVLIIAGLHKFETFSATTAWFDNTLGLPLPGLMAFLAATTEFLGGLLLLFGLAVRLVSLPLMFTMLVAIFTVHLEHGWFAIAPGSADTNPARVFAAAQLPWAKDSLRNSHQVGLRVREARSVLRDSGRYDWLTARGGFVVLQNGIEFAATYLVMLLLLFYYGGGRYVSADYWLQRYLQRRLNLEAP